MGLHNALKRHLKKVGIPDPAITPSSEVWEKFLERISQSFEQYDKERYTLERSLGLSSDEMQELHKKLEKQHNIIKQILSRYVADEVAQEILLNPEEKLKLGGEARLISVLFADIRGFTSFSEKHEAQDVIHTLNTIFQKLVPIIFAEKGTFDKYMGDAIMAFYGAPLSYKHDALRAVRTAVKMQEALGELQEQEPYLKEVGMGVGVFTGYAVVGNLGSEKLMDYTCIGDTPNTAKRLQENAGAGQILICNATYESVKEHVQVKPFKVLELKGKKIPIQSYEVSSINLILPE